MSQRNKTIILKFNFFFPISVKSIEEENWGSKRKEKRRNSEDVGEESAILNVPHDFSIAPSLCVLRGHFLTSLVSPSPTLAICFSLALSISDLIQQQMGRIVSEECKGTKNAPSRPAELLV